MFRSKGKKSSAKDMQSLGESILKGSFESGLLVDESGRVLYANDAATSLSGGAIDSIDQHVQFSQGKWKEIQKQQDTIKCKTKNFEGDARVTSLDKGLYLLYIQRRYSDDDNETSLASAMTEASVEGIMEASLDPVFQIDKQGNIQIVNSAACTMFGWSRKEFVGSNISMIVGSEHTNKHDEYMKRYLKTNVAKVMGKRRRLPARRKDGSEFIIELSVVEVKKDGQHIFCGFVRDLTDHLAREASLEQEKSLNQGIIEASLDPVFQIDTHGIIQMVNSAACTLFGWTTQEFVGRNISMIVGSEHANKHDEYMKRYLQTGVAKVMGKRRRLPARRKDGSEFIIELSVVEVKTEGQHVFCGFVRDLTEILEWEASLEQEKSLVEGIIGASLDPVFQIDTHGLIQNVNSAACTLFGFSREEFLGNNVSVIVGSEHASKHDEYMQRYLKTGVARVMGQKRRLPARRKDGSEFVIELSVVEVKTEGQHVFCGFVHDVSDLLAWQASLEQEKSLMSGVIDAALDPLFQINEKGIIQMVNAAATKQFGWSREEFVGRNISKIVGSEHAANHDQYIERYLKTGVAHVMGTKRELKARRKDGSEFPIQLSLVEVEVEKGKERIFCGFVLDLTEAKEHMAEVQRREDFTNKIIEGSHDALLVTDSQGKIKRVNGAAVSKFQSSESVLRSETIFSLLCPDDSSLLKEKIDECVKAGLPLANLNKEFEAARPNGETFPVAVSVSELEGPKGETFFAFYLHDLTNRKRLMRIEIEKSAAELLLANMLPEQIAGQLKDDPGHIAESHSFAAVLFADIVGFTALSSKLEPREVVAMLNDLFSLFDELVDKYGLNKIKTIGDCYMVTSVPAIVDDEVDHCKRLCHFALDMVAALQAYNSEEREHKLDLRVGVHCGPVVAGVVGTKRFLYDLWGDAVNTASRMESTGVPGKIQTTCHVAELMKDDFVSELRGMVQVKGKGEMQTYFLTDRKKPFVGLQSPSPRRSPEEDAIMMIRRRSTMNASQLRESLRTFENLLEGGLDDLSEEE